MNLTDSTHGSTKLYYSLRSHRRQKFQIAARYQFFFTEKSWILQGPFQVFPRPPAFNEVLADPRQKGTQLV